MTRRALVIGGKAKFVDSSTTPLLAAYGIAVEHHVDMDRTFRSIPPDVDVVIALREMIPGGVPVLKQIQQAAKDVGLPCIASSRHKSELMQRLDEAGFRQVTPVSGEEKQPMAQERPTGTKYDYSSLTFDQLFGEMRTVIRTMKEKHGVSEIIWTQDGPLEVKRVEVRSATVD